MGAPLCMLMRPIPRGELRGDVRNSVRAEPWLPFVSDGLLPFASPYPFIEEVLPFTESPTLFACAALEASAALLLGMVLLRLLEGKTTVGFLSASSSGVVCLRGVAWALFVKTPRC